MTNKYIYFVANWKMFGNLRTLNSLNKVISFVKKNNSNKYFKDVILNLKKIIRDIKKPHIQTVKKYGKACSYPGTFLGSIHAILNSKNYKSAIIKLIKAGGCNCSRANFVGAYFVALNGLKDIPVNWIKKTTYAKSGLPTVMKKIVEIAVQSIQNIFQH